MVIPVKKLTVAYSPCPNDTFMFHDIAAGVLRLDGFEVQTHIHDVQTLNEMATVGRFDVTKLSFYAYLLARDEYQLLGSGAALGYDCGPLVVSCRPMAPAELAGCRVVVPGELTTAHLLFRLWAPKAADRIFARYDRIMPMLAAGQADAGVIIHEGRFVYKDRGLHLLADLGQWWREKTNLPIPLGCIVARRSLGQRTISQLEAMLTKAIENSQANPAGAMEYVRAHAQQIDEAVLAKHITTFVNDYSLDLGDDGAAAVDKLEQMAVEMGVLT